MHRANARDSHAGALQAGASPRRWFTLAPVTPGEAEAQKRSDLPKVSSMAGMVSPVALLPWTRYTYICIYPIYIYIYIYSQKCPSASGSKCLTSTDACFYTTI